MMIKRQALKDYEVTGRADKLAPKTNYSVSLNTDKQNVKEAIQSI
jgi:hypothetical protein